MTHTNKQTAVIIVQKPNGDRWTIGTDSQRGFTPTGAQAAVLEVRKYLPKGWTAWWEELTPLDFLLESCKNLYPPI